MSRVARAWQRFAGMGRHVVIASSTLVAGAVAVALILRPSPTAREHLAAPARIPSVARQIVVPSASTVATAA